MARISRITIAVVVAGAAATAGFGAAIAAAAPPPKNAKQKADFNADKSKPASPPTRVKLPPPGQPGQQAQPGRAQQPAQPQPPEERPESSSGDEQTTSGGS